LEKRISFTVDNLEIFDTNESQFATLSIDAFASGENRHDLYVSEETLKNTSNTIYSKPLVWMYDNRLDDAGSHDPLEVPCGFIPPDSEVSFRKLEDGRTMMNVVGKIWKKYSGELLAFFKRDEGEKPVSVEMEVLKYEQMKDGKYAILDFAYTAITVLGSLITPAIPGARANVVAFAKKEKEDYNKAFNAEFSRYQTIDFTIPEGVRDDAIEGLRLYKEFGRGGNSSALAHARFLRSAKKITPEKAKNMANYFDKHKADNLDDKSSNQWISYCLWGGVRGNQWALTIASQMYEIDNNTMTYFEGEIIEGDNNMTEEEKLALQKAEDEKRSFEKPEDEKPEDEKPEDKMAEEETQDEKDEDEKPKDKMAEETVEGQEQKNCIPDNISAMFDIEGDLYKSLQAEFDKEEVDYSVAFQIMANRISEVQLELDSKNEKLEEYAIENEELKTYKSDIENQKFTYTVDSTLKEVEGDIPKEELEVLRNEASGYTLETIEGWKNIVRAKAFVFSKEKGDEEEPTGDIVVGLPWLFGKESKSKSLWEKNNN